MPQDIHFDIPFPSLISPDAAAARKRNHDWARAHGLVGSELAAQRYLSNDIAGLMARADAALYAAKAGGRNRVEAAPEPGPVSDTPAVRA